MSASAASVGRDASIACRQGAGASAPSPACRTPVQSRRAPGPRGSRSRWSCPDTPAPPWRNREPPAAGSVRHARPRGRLDGHRRGVLVIGGDGAHAEPPTHRATQRSPYARGGSRAGRRRTRRSRSQVDDSTRDQRDGPISAATALSAHGDLADGDDGCRLEGSSAARRSSRLGSRAKMRCSMNGDAGRFAAAAARSARRAPGAGAAWPMSRKISIVR